MAADGSRGLLSLEVKCLPVVAGTRTTVNLIIRNPFLEEITIDFIQAPSSAPLLPQQKRVDSTSDDRGGKLDSLSLINKIVGKFSIREINAGPIRATFPSDEVKTINADLAPKARLVFNNPLGPNDTVNIKAAEEAEIIFNPTTDDTKKLHSGEERTIGPQQEYLASFEIKTAHWLFVTPKTLDLYALVRYRVSGELCSQVAPVSLTIQPPLKSIVLGSLSGGVLGWLARQLNKGILPTDFTSPAIIVSLLAVVVMSMILSIVLSRQDASKGFVTLEDFYGAFVVGVLLGYTGTQYFETSVIKPLQER